ncbi:MAG: alginate lyase family protein [Steroidobacteraceae bacterium]
MWRGAQATQRLRYLRPVRRAPAPRVAVASLRPWTRPSGVSTDDYLAQADQIVAGGIRVFQSTATLGASGAVWSRDPESGVVSPTRPGPFIDYRNPAIVGNARNVWELNRHFHVVALAQAWSLTEDDRYSKAAVGTLKSWLTECPYPVGINWVSALELGIRLVNWYIASRLFGWWGDGSEPVAGLQDSIYWHCKFIERHRSRHSSANNHLLGEMVGLYAAATAWGFWGESARWRDLARRTLIDELPRQVHDDGVSREQTVDYQMFVLQMLLIAGLIGEESGEPFPAEYWATVDRMLGFLESIADVGGNLPAFGDSDDGMLYMLSPQARDSRLPDLMAVRAFLNGTSTSAARSGEAARWLSTGFPRPVHWPARSAARTRAFRDGGYFVLGDRFGKPDEVLLVADAAPLGFLSIAAHGHADCLSFVLSLGGVQVLVDPGTYCYHSDPTWRAYFKGTSAHNTVRVDGVDQSQSVGAFMWARKAEPELEAFDGALSPQRFVASHDGYRRLRDPVRHVREIRFDTAAAEITVIDTLKCRGSHQVERFWHLADHCAVQRRPDGTAEARLENCAVEFVAVDAHRIESFVGSTRPISGWMSRRFGARTPSPTLVMSNDIIGETSLVTRIRWRFE